MIIKHYLNLHDDNVESLSPFDDPFERPAAANVCVLAIPAARATFTGFFWQTVYSIKGDRIVFPWNND